MQWKTIIDTVEREIGTIIIGSNGQWANFRKHNLFVKLLKTKELQSKPEINMILRFLQDIC